MTREERKRYLLKEQEETTQSLWGNEVTFKPYLVKKKFGDGMCLISFGCLDDRPYYWLVRVDSKLFQTNIEKLDFEAIYRQIEEECGYYDEFEEDEDMQDLDCDEIREMYPYPVISRWSSAHWKIIADLRNGVDRCGIKLDF